MKKIKKKYLKELIEDLIDNNRELEDHLEELHRRVKLLEKRATITEAHLAEIHRRIKLLEDSSTIATVPKEGTSRVPEFTIPSSAEAAGMPWWRSNEKV